MKHHSFDWVNEMNDRGIKKTTVCLKEKPQVQQMPQNAILSIGEMKQNHGGTRKTTTCPKR